MRRTHGLAQKARTVIAAVMYTNPRTIASPTPNIGTDYHCTRSPILRHPPRPISYSSFRSATMTTQTNQSSATVDDLDTIFKQKRILRTKVKKDLKSMDPILRSEEDEAIQNIILEAPWFKSCEGLCAYISCSALREVDTSKLLSDILQNTTKDGHSQMGKRLYVPRVEDKNRHMRMLKISNVDDLIANSMNILEPYPVEADGNEREDVMLANDPVELFILPGLAFDKSGKRLGRGGGYYDTLLTNYQELAKEQKWKQPLLVALSYSVQILEEGVIPVTPNDVTIDALVSPSGLILISAAALERCH